VQQGFKPWQLVLLTALFPAVGTFFVFAQPELNPRIKVLALIYCIVVLVGLLVLRRPAGELIVNAVPLS